MTAILALPSVGVAVAAAAKELPVGTTTATEAGMGAEMVTPSVVGPFASAVLVAVVVLVVVVVVDEVSGAVTVTAVGAAAVAAAGAVAVGAG